MCVCCMYLCECMKCNSVVTLALKIHIVIVINDNTQQSANKSALFSKNEPSYFFFSLTIFSCSVFPLIENIIWTRKKKIEKNC